MSSGRRLECEECRCLEVSHREGWGLRRTGEGSPLLRTGPLVPQTNLHQPCSPAQGLLQPCAPSAPLAEVGWLRGAGSAEPAQLLWREGVPGSTCPAENSEGLGLVPGTQGVFTPELWDGDHGVVGMVFTSPGGCVHLCVSEILFPPAAPCAMLRYWLD